MQLTCYCFNFHINLFCQAFTLFYVNLTCYSDFISLGTSLVIAFVSVSIISINKLSIISITIDSTSSHITNMLSPYTYVCLAISGSSGSTVRTSC